MKRIIQLLICLGVVCGLSVSAFATEGVYQNAGELYHAWTGTDSVPDYVCGGWSLDGGSVNLAIAILDDDNFEIHKQMILDLIVDDSTVSIVGMKYSYAYLYEIFHDSHYVFDMDVGLVLLGVDLYENRVEFEFLDKYMDDSGTQQEIQKLKGQYGEAVSCSFIDERHAPALLPDIEHVPAPDLGDDTTYFVAGVEALCGSNWVANDPANEMTKGDNGIYTITYKNVAAGKYSLKVTDGTWTNSWGGDGVVGNFDFVVTANTDIIVEFDPSKTEVSVIVNGVYVGRPILLGNVDSIFYYVSGDEALCGSNWVANDPANKMTYKDGIYTITYKNVAKGHYSLKVTNGTWEKSWGHTGENGNFDFEVTSAGDVTVEFNPAKGLVTIVMGDTRIDGTPAPETGDVSLAAVSVALLAATAGLVAIVSKKKEF